MSGTGKQQNKARVRIVKHTMRITTASFIGGASLSARLKIRQSLFISSVPAVAVKKIVLPSTHTLPFDSKCIGSFAFAFS
jgi:hypothetical protein